MKVAELNPALINITKMGVLAPGNIVHNSAIYVQITVFSATGGGSSRYVVLQND